MTEKARELWGMALHEGGHFVVAEVADLNVSRARVFSGLDDRGPCSFGRLSEAVHDAMRAAMYRRRKRDTWPYSVAAVGGGVADSIHSGEPLDLCNARYDGDVAALVEMAATCTAPNADGGIDVDPFMERAKSEARALLEAHWGRVEEVAGDLVEAVEDRQAAGATLGGVTSPRARGFGPPRRGRIQQSPGTGMVAGLAAVVV